MLSDVHSCVYTYTEQDVASKTNDVYTVLAENRRGDEVIFSKECSFNVELWPRPEVFGSVSDTNGYWGQVVKTPLEMVGGYEGAWSYKMTVNGTEMHNIDNNFAYIIFRV